MAEPLSAFDVARTRFGFGTSGDPAERQRFAEAGLSPLTSEERMRMERGWGASPLASKESREAMVVEEVRRGDRPAYQLPEAYGGRPEGTTRRAIRMQQAWDAEQAARIQQEKANQQYEMEQKRFAIDAAREMRQQREYDLSVEAGLAKEERESAIQNEAKFIFETIRGGRAVGTNPDGTTRYSEPINLNDPKSVDTLYRMASMPFGMQNQAAKEIVTMMLDDALRIQETKGSQFEKQAEQQKSFIVGQQEEASSLGVDTSKFFTTKIDPETQQQVVTGVDEIGLSKAIGEAKRQESEKRQMEIKEAKVSDEIRSEAKDVIKDIEDVDKQIREANFMASREEGEANRDEYLARAEYLRAERDVLTTRYNNLIPQKQEEQQAGDGGAQPKQKELTPQDQAALDWANANPDDPRSQRIKAKLGVQ